MLSIGKSAQFCNQIRDLINTFIPFERQVQKHSVLNEKNETVELCSSVECKGIIGNDGRHYILDLLRTFPPDLNFLPVEGVELPAECQRQSFPRQHRHRLACLRQELIEAFVEHR